MFTPCRGEHAPGHRWGACSPITDARTRSTALARILKDPEGNKGFEDDSNAAAPPKPPPPRASANSYEHKGRPWCEVFEVLSVSWEYLLQQGKAQPNDERWSLTRSALRHYTTSSRSSKRDVAAARRDASSFGSTEPDHQPLMMFLQYQLLHWMTPKRSYRRCWTRSCRTLRFIAEHWSVLDDVPLSAKRKEIPREDPSTDHVHKKIRVAYVFALASMFEGLDAPQNEWLSRYEAAMLKSLTGLEVTSARLHRAPRKRMQVPTKARNRARTSDLIGGDPTVTLHGGERTGGNETSFPLDRPIFHREKTHKRHRVYVELPGGLIEKIEVKMHPEEADEFHALWREEIRDLLVADALILRRLDFAIEGEPEWIGSQVLQPRRTESLREGGRKGMVTVARQ